MEMPQFFEEIYITKLNKNSQKPGPPGQGQFLVLQQCVNLTSLSLAPPPLGAYKGLITKKNIADHPENIEPRMELAGSWFSGYFLLL